MERLRKLREAKKMTQLRLAMELELSQETISGYETGKAIPPADVLMKLADLFNTSLDYLLERTDNKEFRPLMKSDLTEKERELVALYREISSDKKERAIGLMMGLKD